VARLLWLFVDGVALLAVGPQAAAFSELGRIDQVAPPGLDLLT